MALQQGTRCRFQARLPHQLRILPQIPTMFKNSLPSISPAKTRIAIYPGPCGPSSRTIPIGFCKTTSARVCSRNTSRSGTLSAPRTQFSNCRSSLHLEATHAQFPAQECLLSGFADPCASCFPFSHLPHAGSKKPLHSFHWISLLEYAARGRNTLRNAQRTASSLAACLTTLRATSSREHACHQITFFVPHMHTPSHCGAFAMFGKTKVETQ